MFLLLCLLFFFVLFEYYFPLITSLVCHQTGQLGHQLVPVDCLLIVVCYQMVRKFF